MSDDWFALALAAIGSLFTLLWGREQKVALPPGAPLPAARPSSRRVAPAIVGGVAASVAAITVAFAAWSVRITSTDPGQGTSDPTGELYIFERFLDSDVSGRGWYDDTTVPVTGTEFFSSDSSLEASFSSSATTPTGLGSMRFTIPGGGTDSLYLAYRVRYSDGFIGSGQNYHPHEFVVVSDLDGQYTGPRDTYLSLYSESNYQDTIQLTFGLRDRLNIDTNYIGVDLTDSTEARGLMGCNGDTDGYPSTDCYDAGGGTWVNGKFWDAGVQIPDSSWHLVEVVAIMNSVSGSVGQTDAVFKAWLDSTLVVDRDDMIFRTNENATMKFEQVILAPYIGDGSPQAQTIWYDDIVVASARDYQWTVPDTPAISGTGNDSTLDLSTSAFSAGTPGDVHASTSWQIDELGGDFSSPVWQASASDSLESYSDAGISVPLPSDSSFIVRARHEGTYGGNSAWSTIDTVATTDPGGGGFNEPAGFTEFAAADFDDETLGDFIYFDTGPGSYAYVGGKLEVTYPSGMVDGQAPLLIRPSGPAGGPAAYLRFNITMDANWDGNGSGVNKIVFHTRRGDDNPMGYLMMNGSGSSPLYPAINTQNWPMGTTVLDKDGGSNLASPSDTDAEVVRGEETLIEMLTHHGTAGNADGYIKVWVDGTLVLHYENLALTPSGFTPGVGGEYPKFDMIWGGNEGDTVPYDMTITYDDIYSSVGTP